MEYFTKKGVQQVIAKYENQIGNDFYFDETGVKYKLKEIIYAKSICDDGYHILFLSENVIFKVIYQFMSLNNIEFIEKNMKYNFEDFDRTSLEI